jgi:hypothetical protein
MQDIPILQAPSLPDEAAPVPETPKPKPAPPEPPKEKVPFDQWLLSERNIKIALYSGGLLLLIAGIIFIGVNWTRIPGPGKFAITLLVTGLMYLGGYLLVQRPAYKIGGVALLGIASGFFVLNFAVLQIYVMGPRGMADNVMWLIASPFCLLLYMLTAYGSTSDLFTYFSLFALGSTLTAGLVVAGASELTFLLTFSLWGLVLSILAQGLKITQLEEFTYQPLMICAHLLIPLTFLWSLGILAAGSGLLPLNTGSLWISFAVLALGSIFYSLNAYWYKSPIATYLGLVAWSIALTAALVLANVPFLVYLLSYALLSMLMLVLAQAVKTSSRTNFIHKPLLITSNILMPLTYITTFFYLLAPFDQSNPWLYLIVLGLGVVFYLLLAYRSRHIIFSYASLVAIAGLGSAILFLLEVPLLVYPLAGGLFALTCLILARLFQDTAFCDFTRFPLLSTAQAAMPLVIFLAVSGWISHELMQENPWLPLIALWLSVLFYIFTDVLFKRLEGRWAAAVLVPITLGLTFYQLNFSFRSIGISLMVLAIFYLGIGYALENRENRKSGGWPFYATAYAISGLVTILALPNTADLATILFADVAILVISAAIHRVYWWIYGAVWLFMVPIYLTTNLYVSEFHYQGLLMGLLGLNYTAAGYILGRRELRLGAPFLTAAAFLSVVTIVLTWTNPMTATFVISATAILYFLVGIWLGWPWILFPALVLLDLVVLSVNSVLFGYESPIGRALLISYSLLGVVLLTAGVILRRTNQDRWSWPLYAVGAINICGSYLISLAFANWFTIGISAVLAILMFTFAWLERKFIARFVKIPLLTYLGIGILFLGHFILLSLLAVDREWEVIWPAYTTGLCATFVVLASLLRRDPIEQIYSIPLRWSGLFLMAVPLMGSLVMFLISLSMEPNPVIVAVTFAIAGATFAGDAVIRRSSRESYLGFGSLLIVIWAASSVYHPRWGDNIGYWLVRKNPGRISAL